MFERSKGGAHEIGVLEERHDEQMANTHLVSVLFLPSSLWTSMESDGRAQRTHRVWDVCVLVPQLDRILCFCRNEGRAWRVGWRGMYGGRHGLCL